MVSDGQTGKTISTLYHVAISRICTHEKRSSNVYEIMRKMSAYISFENDLRIYRGNGAGVISKFRNYAKENSKVMTTNSADLRDV